MREGASPKTAKYGVVISPLVNSRGQSRPSESTPTPFRKAPLHSKYITGKVAEFTHALDFEVQIFNDKGWAFNSTLAKLETFLVRRSKSVLRTELGNGINPPWTVNASNLLRTRVG